MILIGTYEILSLYLSVIEEHFASLYFNYTQDDDHMLKEWVSRFLKHQRYSSEDDVSEARAEGRAKRIVLYMKMSNLWRCISEAQMKFQGQPEPEGTIFKKVKGVMKITIATGFNLIGDKQHCTMVYQDSYAPITWDKCDILKKVFTRRVENMILSTCVRSPYKVTDDTYIAYQTMISRIFDYMVKSNVYDIEIAFGRVWVGYMSTSLEDLKMARDKLLQNLEIDAAPLDGNLSKWIAFISEMLHSS